MNNAEEWISDLEDKVMESNEVEQKRERRVLQHKNRLRELSDLLKRNNICITEVSEDEEGEKGGGMFMWAKLP